MKKINFYIFKELLKGFLLILFIFISIAWLMQFTRLMSVTNLIQIDSFSIFKLSLLLIPNLFSVILPFIIIIGISITFIKLYKDREIITIYTLGLNTEVIKKPLIVFSISIIFISILLNFFLSPNIYEKYKKNEFELRNTINFEKIIFSNFLELNEDTIIDFKKSKKNFIDIFINYSDVSENIIYAKQGSIKKVDNIFTFNLDDGFKLTILENGNIEKLEFANYNLEFEDQNFKEYNNDDKNTSNFLEDIDKKNYLNLSFKIYDSLIFIFIFVFFYFYNLKSYKFEIKNIIIFILFCSSLLIFNQLIKNLDTSFIIYILSTSCYLIFFILIFYYLTFASNEQN